MAAQSGQAPRQHSWPTRSGSCGCSEHRRPPHSMQSRTCVQHVCCKHPAVRPTTQSCTWHRGRPRTPPKRVCSEAGNVHEGHAPELAPVALAVAQCQDLLLLCLPGRPPRAQRHRIVRPDVRAPLRVRHNPPFMSPSHYARYPSRNPTAALTQYSSSSAPSLQPDNALACSM